MWPAVSCKDGEQRTVPVSSGSRCGSDVCRWILHEYAEMDNVDLLLRPVPDVWILLVPS